MISQQLSPHNTYAMLLSAMLNATIPNKFWTLVFVAEQISHTFFDAPGAQAATFVEGTEATVASPSKPYVTMVFCGPADYKVCASCA